MSGPPARPLGAEARAEIARLVGLYEHRQSALLPALFVAQREHGYLSPEALAGVAEALDLPVSEVASVASFYRLFYLKPVGRHVIQVCTNLACMLNGCAAVVRRFGERLGVASGETTADGRFTLRTVECLAACEEAPAVLVDEDRWARVTPGDIDRLLERYP
ncbi:MAG: NADH-quinone oxidoreductase subunit NuoE [Armatimonadota bacterium]|nr:NADH-quinone oxidoreductase subunit NuoE [Armatimonadota bacterium]MDR7456576.1 NADH-quinone oxidoreductase subunit NuoE [Armatimonadota bacterium]MDR7497363.1 NADH-quinone oxidoreductase subunit NuoE [Armatimonadota bacterium]MDR7512429.1 NADH-quinone oxidoreductase subunit NuoE [Armatimonadota bacterium]